MFKKIIIGALALVVAGAVAVGVYDWWRVSPASAQTLSAGVGRGQGGQGQGGQGQGQAGNAGQNATAGVPQSVPSTAWVDQTGVVQSVAVNGVSLTTDAGQALWIQLGPNRFWGASLSFKAGDHVTVTGFTENGQFMAAKVVNDTTGQTLTLRNDAGQPLWTGGNGQGGNGTH